MAVCSSKMASDPLPFNLHDQLEPLECNSRQTRRGSASPQSAHTSSWRNDVIWNSLSFWLDWTWAPILFCDRSTPLLIALASEGHDVHGSLLSAFINYSRAAEVMRSVAFVCSLVCVSAGSQKTVIRFQWIFLKSRITGLNWLLCLCTADVYAPLNEFNITDMKRKYSNHFFTLTFATLAWLCFAR